MRVPARVVSQSDRGASFSLLALVSLSARPPLGTTQDVLNEDCSARMRGAIISGAVVPDLSPLGHVLSGVYLRDRSAAFQLREGQCQ